MPIDRDQIDLANNATGFGVGFANNLIAQINNLKSFTSDATNEISLLEPVNAAAVTSEIDRLNKSLINYECILELPTGASTFTSPLILDGQGSKNLTIKGQTPDVKTISNVFGSSGSTKNWAVVYTLNNVTDISVGNFVFVDPSDSGSNTGEYYAHKGLWEVTNVDAGNSRITLKNTLNKATFPSTTISVGNIHVMKSVLKFNNSDGLRILHSGVGVLEDVAIVGDFNVTNSSGNVRDGITVGNLNGLEHGNTSILTTGVVGVCNFGGYGLQVFSDCYFSSETVSTNSNGKSGIRLENTRSKVTSLTSNGNLLSGLEITSASACVSDNTTACGNGNHGILVDNGSQFQTEDAYIYSNTQNGVKVDDQSFAGLIGSKITSNGFNGLSASLDSLIKANSSEIRYSSLNGVECTKNSVVDVTSSTISNNSNYGVRSLDNSIIYSNSVTFASNTSGDYNSNLNSKIINAAGNIIEDSSTNCLSFVTAAGNHGMKIAGSASSSGIFSRVISGVSTDVLELTNTGVLTPILNSCALGSDSSGFLIAYLQSLVVGTTNKVSFTSGANSPESSVSANPGSLYFRTGGIEPRTYIKRTGTGSTGWQILGIQPGDIKIAAVAADESGWLFCDGRSINRTTYADLFAKIGTTFGSASGSTFNIPDMRASTPVGVDPGLSTGRIDSGSTNGANVGDVGGRFGTQNVTLTTNQIPSHSHGPLSNVDFGLNDSANPASNIIRKGSAPVNKDALGGSNSGSTGGGQSHSNVQPSIALAFLIKV